MSFSRAVAALALLASVAPITSADVIIEYDSLNRPTKATGLEFFLVRDAVFEITIDYSGKSFNEQFGAAESPGGSPGGLIWNNFLSTLAKDWLSTTLWAEMVTDSQPPPGSTTTIFFPYTADASTFRGPSVFHISVPFIGTSDWTREANVSYSRSEDDFRPGADHIGWATVTVAVPESNSFFCLGLVGIVAFGIRHRTRSYSKSRFRAASVRNS